MVFRDLCLIGGGSQVNLAMGICALCCMWKLIWCNGFPQIYARLEGVHLPNMNWLWNLLYMKLIYCNGFPEIYAWLEGGVGSICHRYMCIVLYMKLIWCNGFPEIYAQLEEGVGGQSPMCICALCYIWNLFGVMVFQRSMLDWRRGWGQSTMGICALCYI